MYLYMELFFMLETIGNDVHDFTDVAGHNKEILRQFYLVLRKSSVSILYSDIKNYHKSCLLID